MDCAYDDEKWKVTVNAIETNDPGIVIDIYLRNKWKKQIILREEE